MPFNTKYPPLNFQFVVDFENQEFSLDKGFQSVTGLCVKLNDQDNHQEMVSVFDNLILKRAYEPNSKLVEWCMKAINHKNFIAENLQVKLLNSDHKLLSAWSVEQAIPVGWGVDELNAQEGKILMETIELKYKLFQVLNSKGNIIAPIHRTRS